MPAENSTEDEFTDFEDIGDIDDEYSEISGDCNESQPCRGDEPWLDSECDFYNSSHHDGR